MSKAIQMKDENENMYPNPHFPVGSIYLSVLDTNPSVWFGGTWEQIAKGRTLVGVDENDTDFDTVKKTGGSKKLQEHTHSIPQAHPWNATEAEHYALMRQSTTRRTEFNVATSATGDGNSGNLQPYFTCYIWCRIA